MSGTESDPTVESTGSDARRRLRSAALVAVGLAAGPVVALGFTRFAYALLLPAMRSDLDWSFTTAGGITTANAIGYVIGAASAAWWAKRFGERSVFIAGMVISAIALLVTALSGDYVFLTIVRFIGGLSTSVVFVVGSALASRIRVATPKQSALMVSIYIAGVGAGIVLSGIVVPAMLGWLGDAGWPEGWLVMGILAVVAIWPTVVASKRVEPPAHASGPGASFAFLTPTFVWYLLYGAGYVSYLTFVVALVGEEGLSGWVIAAFFIVIGLSSVLGTLLVWGGVIARLSSAVAPAVITVVVMVGVIPVLVWPGVVGAFISAVIFGAGFMAGPTAATVTAKRFLPAASLTSGLAALTAAFSVGQAIGPVASGIVSDTMFGIMGGLWLSVVLLIAAAVVVLFQRPPAERR
ncbi:YbfB/YjiJ family MFS transporter [Herbiconiux sp. P17]|uniref:YbfB/YjiJ family MFS transporter n=1 Tax=Herbiconiux wuyangfengii TaxID=3342794 RepID=UPI0035B80EE3